MIDKVRVIAASSRLRPDSSQVSQNFKGEGWSNVKIFQDIP